MALYQWVLEMRDLNLPVHGIQIKRKATEMIKTSHPLFKASTGGGLHGSRPDIRL